jgi:hypothetical protein
MKLAAMPFARASSAAPLPDPGVVRHADNAPMRTPAPVGTLLGTLSTRWAPGIALGPSSNMPTTCKDFGGRGRYRTADRWCVNPSQSVHGISHGAVASSNAQLSGCLISALSTMCRAVSACLGTLLAQRGFDRQAIRRRQDASWEAASDAKWKPLRYAAL